MLELSRAGTNRAYSVSPLKSLCRGMSDMQTKQSAVGKDCGPVMETIKACIILRSCYDRPHQASASDLLRLLHQVNKKILYPRHAEKR